MSRILERHTPIAPSGPALWLKWTAAGALVSVATAAIAVAVSPDLIGFLIEWFLFAALSSILQALILRAYLPGDICLRWAVNSIAASILASLLAVCSFTQPFPAVLLIYPIYGIAIGIGQAFVFDRRVKSPAGRVPLSSRWAVDNLMGSIVWLLSLFVFLSVLDFRWLDSALGLPPLTDGSDMAISFTGVAASWVLATTIYGALMGRALDKLLKLAAIPPVVTIADAEYVRRET